MISRCDLMYSIIGHIPPFCLSIHLCWAFVANNQGQLRVSVCYAVGMDAQIWPTSYIFGKHKIRSSDLMHHMSCSTFLRANSRDSIVLGTIADSQTQVTDSGYCCVP